MAETAEAVMQTDEPRNPATVKRDAAPVLEVRGLSKRFGAVRALHEVSFSLYPGEVVGLIGYNGAGKSTLVNIIAGSLQPDRGEILVDGVERRFENAAQARASGIETVFQFLSLIPTLDMAENVFLNREIFGFGKVGQWLRWMDKAEMRRQTSEGFSRLGLTLPSPATKVTALSGGQRQAVAIARAVLWGSHIVVLDEPAAALGVKQTEIVLAFIERLSMHGVACIFISHNMEHVMRVADRIVLLRLGEKIFDAPASETTAPDLVSMMTGATAARGV
jgi:simple sugar transport system ATP-binding protein